MGEREINPPPLVIAPSRAGVSAVATKTSNPYSPPEGSAPVQRTSSAAASVLVLALFCVLSLRAFRATIYLAMMAPWELARDLSSWLTPDTLWLSWVLTRPLLLLAVASFCWWIYRANQDARALGAENLAFSPAWAVAVGFIPIVNLIGPYRAVKEIFQASFPANEPPGIWRRERAPAALPLWWGLWIASLAWNLVPYGTLTPRSPVWGQATLELLRAGAALVLILVVRGIERRQAALAFPATGKRSSALQSAL